MLNHLDWTARFTSILVFAFLLMLFGCQTVPPKINDQEITVGVYETGVPQTEQEYWEIANRLWQLSDFDDDWLQDTYLIQIGTDKTTWNYQAGMGMKICSTRQTRVNRKPQAAYCLTQVIYKYPSQQLAQERFNKYFERSNWPNETDFFDFSQDVDEIGISCGEGTPREYLDLYEPYNICLAKIRHGPYFVTINVFFSLDEEPISFDEIGELFDVLQKKLIDPASDIAPEGYEPFIEIGS